MPRIADIPRSPEEFAPLLQAEEPLFLVDGQAVNLWALYYGDWTAGLAPFVSRDVDVLGDRKTLLRLARTAGGEPQFFPLRPPTNEVGVVIARDGQGTPLLVEVLRHVHGVTNEQLKEHVYTVAIGENGVRVQIPGPIALMQAKIANVADIAQVGRQDMRHVQILARLMPAYLADMVAAVTAKRMEERALVGMLEHLLNAASSVPAVSVLRDAQVDRGALFADLKADSLPKVRSFLEKRLPRVLCAGRNACAPLVDATCKTCNPVKKT